MPRPEGEPTPEDPSATPVHAEPSTLELDDQHQRRMPRRRRLIEAGAIVVVLTAVVAGLVYSVIAPSHAPHPGPHPIVLLSNVSYGTILLNGQPLGGPPPLILPLRSGANDITLTAAPFRPHSCHEQWDGQGSFLGNCSALGDITSITIDGKSVSPGLVLFIALTGDDLPPNLYASARAIVSHWLAASPLTVSVPTGSYIAAGGHWPDAAEGARVMAPGQATATFTLYAEGDLSPRHRDCDATTDFCAGPLFDAAPPRVPAGVWTMSLDAAFTWIFTSSSGLSRVSIVYALQPPVTLALTYDARNGWHMPQQLVPAVGRASLADRLAAATCGAGAYMLTAETQAIGDTVRTLANKGIQGCALQLVSQPGGSDGTFVWRFGVLLAADAAARAVLPDIPQAPPAELAAVGLA